MIPETYPGQDGANYLVFDGLGIVTDWGVFSPASPPGTYTMRADSSGTIHLRIAGGHDAGVVCAVKLTSGDAGRLAGTTGADTLRADLVRVIDPGRMAGAWTGEMQALARDIPCTIRVNEEGVVVGSDGLTGPVSGRVYATPAGLAAAFLRTGEPDGFRQVHLGTGTVAGDTWSGTLGVDQTGGEGTFAFTRR
jgi:hypothetical protein